MCHRIQRLQLLMNVKQIHVVLDVIPAVRTVNVETIMELPFVPVCLVLLEALPLVGQSAFYRPNVVAIRRVSIKNV